MTDDEMTMKRAAVVAAADVLASQPRWLGISREGIREHIAAQIADQMVKELTGISNASASDILGQTFPYAPEDVRRAETHRELLTIAMDDLLERADEAAVQRGLVLKLFYHHDQLRRQVQRGQPIDVEALAALGAEIATAVATLQEAMAAPQAQPVAA